MSNRLVSSVLALVSNPVVRSIVLSKGSEPFMRDLVRAATRPRLVAPEN